MKTETLSLKIDAELKNEFKLVADFHHRPVSQVIRDLMRDYVLTNRQLNELTVKTLSDSENNKELHTVKSTEELFEQLGI